MKGLVRFGRSLPATTIGILLVALTVAAFVVVYQKDRYATYMRSGESVEVHFDRAPNVQPFVSPVKIADVEVGKVTGLREAEDGTTVVTAKVDQAVVDRLGAEPTARVRANLILGGRHHLELVPSDKGRFTGTIPTSRTAPTEELGDVLQAFGPDARQGMRSALERLDTTLDAPTEKLLQDVLRKAPDTGGPAIPVFRGVRGTRPDQDLATLVPDLRNLAEGMGSDQRRLNALASGLEGTTDALARSRRPLSRAIEDLPRTLPQGRAALDDVTSVLNEVQRTASTARPTVRALRPLLSELDLALREGRPVVRDLRPLLDDTLPVARDLVPLSAQARRTLGNLDGPVIERLRGPVVDFVNDDWHGTGKYEGNGNDNPLYKEVGYLTARAANQSKFVDRNGTFLSLALGAGATSVGGTSINLYQHLRDLGMPQIQFDPMGGLQPGSSSDDPEIALVPESHGPGGATAPRPMERPTQRSAGANSGDPLGDALSLLTSGGSR